MGNWILANALVDRGFILIVAKEVLVVESVFRQIWRHSLKASSRQASPIAWAEMFVRLRLAWREGGKQGERGDKHGKDR